MDDPTEVPITTRQLRALTLLALRFMHYRIGWPKQRIGVAIGYGDGQMVSRVMRLPEHPKYTPLLGTLETWNLSRLASAHDFDPMSDEASSPCKQSVTVPATLEGCEPDDDPLPELLAVQRFAGLTNAHLNAGDDLRTDQDSRRLLRAVVALRRDVPALLDESFAGDGLPAETLIAR